jgi:toxin ParE1/3/4
MAFTVLFTLGARNDLRTLHAYIASNDSPQNADYVVRGIIRVALTLRDLPDRGTHPPELLTLGNRSYRQVFFKPYRILCRIRQKSIFIAVIADGRRDMLALLTRRITGA